MCNSATPEDFGTSYIDAMCNVNKTTLHTLLFNMSTQCLVSEGDFRSSKAFLYPSQHFVKMPLSPSGKSVPLRVIAYKHTLTETSDRQQKKNVQSQLILNCMYFKTEFSFITCVIQTIVGSTIK